MTHTKQASTTWLPRRFGQQGKKRDALSGKNPVVRKKYSSGKDDKVSAQKR